MSISFTGGIKIPTGGGIQTTIAGAGAVSGDATFVSNVLCLPMDSDFVDVSVHALTPTLTGSPTIDTGDKQFGAGSGDFSTTNSFARYSQSEIFEFGKNDFTAECWVKPLTLTSSGAFITTADPSDQRGFFLGHTGTSLLFLVGAGVWQGNITGGTLSTGVWQHVALVRDGDDMYGYIDGVQVATQTLAAGFELRNDNNTIQVGGRNISSQFSEVHLDDVRVTKGIARYPGGTTFDVPTSAHETTFPAALGTGHRYWRFEVLEASTTISELGMFYEGQNNFLNQYPFTNIGAAQSTSFPTQLFSHINNRDLANVGDFAFVGGNPFDVYVDFGQGNEKEVTKYLINPQTSSFNSPGSFNAYSSDDASDWTLEKAFTGIGALTPGVFNEFDLTT